MDTFPKPKLPSLSELRRQLTAEGNEVEGWGKPRYRYTRPEGKEIGYTYSWRANRAGLEAELLEIAYQRATFKSRVKEQNELEFKAMKADYLATISYFEKTQEKIQKSALKVSDLTKIEAALTKISALEEHILELSRFNDGVLPSYLKESKTAALSALIFDYLKGEGGPLLQTWVAALTRENPTSTRDGYISQLSQLSDQQLVSFSKLAKITILIEGALNYKDPQLFRALEVKGGYLKIPLAALFYFDRGAPKDFVEINDLSNTDIEAIIVLHGGAAYKKLEDAAQAAINLR